MIRKRASSISKHWLAILLMAVALILLVVVSVRTERAPSTDDAYVYADTIDVVPEVDGRIIEMPVRDNQLVHQGDLLFRVDPRLYQDTLDAAIARLHTLDQQIKLTQRTVNAQVLEADSALAIVKRSEALTRQATDTLNRLQPLEPRGFASAQEVERAQNARKAAMAELETARLQAERAAAAVSGVDALVAQRAEVRAQISIARIHLEFTEVRAPFTGRVTSLRTSVGQYATALKPVFTLIDARQWYVVANFRETDLAGITSGMPAKIYLMGDTRRSFEGSVDSIGYGVLPDDGGVVVEGLPRVRRNINWVHVSQRFPVKIAVRSSDPDLFRIGTSAVAVLLRDGDTRESAK
ncbi:multidrug transporter subunit MdtN [Pseudomonas sp. S5F11]|uniref:multidrug transporter subunit MdtN n=1 Tax=Pseudomonas sp. S5F11 TaxID=2866385 RepID=UPI001C7CE379|nr:multidrug transporter subunit MdtN [Pseudomonas sp. S5F11]MBX4135960.1 multidrug transporter subunit MdtN [Pseudomonas sp. S5F11]